MGSAVQEVQQIVEVITLKMFKIIFPGTALKKFLPVIDEEEAALFSHTSFRYLLNM